MTRTLTNSNTFKERAKKIVPHLTGTFSRAAPSYIEGVFPVYAQNAHGSHFIDVDGNEGKILLGASTILKHSSLKAIIIEMPYKNYDYCYSKLLESGFIQVKDDSIKTQNQIWVRENIL